MHWWHEFMQNIIQLYFILNVNYKQNKKFCKSILKIINIIKKVKINFNLKKQLFYLMMKT